MKRYHFLEKRRTWALLLASLLLPPVLVLGFPRENYMEDFQLISERIYGRSRTEPAKPAQKDVTAEVVALQDKYDFAALSTSLRTITQNVYGNSGVLGATPSAKPMIDCLATKVIEPLFRYAEVASSGGITFPGESIGFLNMFQIVQGAPTLAINYVAPQEFLHIATLLATDAFARNETTQAVALLEKGMDVLRPFPWSDRLISGHIFPVLRSWLGALPAESDSAPVRDSLARMSANRSKQPDNQYVPEFTPFASIFFKSWVARRVQMDSAAYLAKEGGWMKHGENRAWASSMDTNQRNDWRSRARLTNELFPFPLWTVTHMQKRKIEHIVRTEPELTWKRLGKPEIFKGIDPVTAALYPYFGAQMSASVVDQERVQLTQKALLQLGCAAHEYRREHGRWPSDVSELPAAAVAAVPAIDNSIGRKRHFDLLEKKEMAYGPITMGEQEITTETLEAFLGLPAVSSWQRLPEHTSTEISSSETSRTFELVVAFETHASQNTAFPIWLVSELIQQDTKVHVTTMSLSMVSTTGDLEPIVSAAQAFFLSTGYNWPSEFVDCRDQTIAALPDGKEVPATTLDRMHSMGSLILRATVEVPRKAFAIHSYGPNGTPGDFGRRNLVVGATAPEQDQILFLN